MKKFTITQQITNRDSKSIDKYFNDISRKDYDPLEVDEEIELSKRAKNGDDEAMEKIVKANLRFVVSVAKTYQNMGLTLPDLIEEGNIGLIKAVHRYNETKGFKLISYAVWWIRQSIMQAISEQGRIVRLPQNQINLLNKINKAQSDLLQDLKREASSDELADILDMDVDSINYTISSNTSSLSLDKKVTEEDESSTLGELIPDENIGSADKDLEKSDLVYEIDKALSSLSDRDKEIVKMCFGIGYEYPMDMDEVAEHFELTRERVRQIKVNSLKYLKSCENLRSFLG